MHGRGRIKLHRRRVGIGGIRLNQFSKLIWARSMPYSGLGCSPTQGADGRSFGYKDWDEQSIWTLADGADRILGSGSFAHVLLGARTADGERVAVKVSRARWPLVPRRNACMCSKRMPLARRTDLAPWPPCASPLLSPMPQILDKAHEGNRADVLDGEVQVPGYYSTPWGTEKFADPLLRS